MNPPSTLVHGLCTTFTFGSCSDGLVSSHALDVTLHDGAMEQSSTAPRSGCVAKPGKCPLCNTSCPSVLLGWLPAQARVLPLGIRAGQPCLVLQVTLKY